jgi:hypothetical protein
MVSSGDQEVPTNWEPCPSSILFSVSESVHLKVRSCSYLLVSYTLVCTDRSMIYEAIMILPGLGPLHCDHFMVFDLAPQESVESFPTRWKLGQNTNIQICRDIMICQDLFKSPARHLARRPLFRSKGRIVTRHQKSQQACRMELRHLKSHHTPLKCPDLSLGLHKYWPISTELDKAGTREASAYYV